MLGQRDYVVNLWLLVLAKILAKIAVQKTENVKTEQVVMILLSPLNLVLSLLVLIAVEDPAALWVLPRLSDPGMVLGLFRKEPEAGVSLSVLSGLEKQRED